MESTIDIFDEKYQYIPKSYKPHVSSHYRLNHGKHTAVALQSEALNPFNSSNLNDSTLTK
jgi:hypothetical protein